MLSGSKGDIDGNDLLSKDINVCHRRRKPEGETQKDKERRRELEKDMEGG